MTAEVVSTRFFSKWIETGDPVLLGLRSTASRKSFDQVAREYKSGKGWGEIAKENNVNLGKVVSDLKRTNKQVEENRSIQARTYTQRSGATESGQGNSSNPRATPTAAKEAVLWGTPAVTPLPGESTSRGKYGVLAAVY